ncbi:NAD-binding protein [Bacillus shivajii]|uniref:NAD-binding protein n=1 Tax=Bacillus shivajii TaxID=1983719 RepID=UPI001CFC170B|nr:NAD-binding protein [Bacillus shivajii]UCZ52900.1 NAD-binding protein [Bacillus shivajii]
MQLLMWLKKIHIIIVILLSLLLILHLLNVYSLNDPGYIFLLVVLLGFSFTFYRVFKSYEIQSISFLIAFGSGFYGFLNYSYTDYSLLNTTYSTFRLFLLDVDPVFNEAGTKYFNLPLAMEVARWSAAFYTISTISLIAFRYFRQVIFSLRLRVVGNHIIVAGYNDRSSKLIENLTKEGYKVGVIADKLTNKQQSAFHDQGITYFDGTKSGEQIYKKCGLKNCKYIIVFHDDDSKNLDTYISMKDFFSNNQLNDDQKEILIHLEYQNSIQLFNNMVIDDERKHMTSKLKPRIFNVYQLIAERQLECQPLYKGYEKQLRNEDESSLHLLFIGFGKVNQQIAFHALNLGHFLTKKPLEITIIDRDIDRVKKEWGFSVKNVDKVAKVRFKKVDLVSQFLSEEIHQLDKPVTHAFISLKDDFLDMIEGLQLTEQFSEVPIFVKMKDDRLVSEWLDQHQKEFKSIRRYSFFHEVLTGEYVLNEKLQRLAEEAHSNYQQRKVELNLPSDKPWEELNSFKRESNRFQMLHNDTKLMLLGLKKVPLEKTEFKSEKEFYIYIQPYLEDLAEVEHKRWNAFHFLRGWNALTDYKSSYTNNPDKKLHACLVSWEELTTVSNVVGTDYKSYDRDSIIHLYHYYYAQGYGFQREK